MNASESGISFSLQYFMKNSLLSSIDKVIDQFQKENKQLPLYVVVSPEEAKIITENIRHDDDLPEDHIITSYRDVKIAPNPSLLNGKSYASNDLPETGS